MPSFAQHVEEIDEATSIKWNNRVYEMRQNGEDITVLSFGEAYFDIPLFSFDNLPFPGIYHYSHSRGILGLREKLCSYYEQNYGVPVDAQKEIIVTAGSKAAIYMSLLTIINPGDEVIVHEPTWVSYTEHIKLCHAVPVLAPCTASITDLEKYVTKKTKAIIVCNPNNPRGYRISEKEMQYLHALAEKHDLFLLSDEAYSDYVTSSQQFVSAGKHDPKKTHTIICNSMSKNFGMSGWRIGYVMTNETLTRQILKVNQHLITCPATILEYYLQEYFDKIIQITAPQIKAVVEKRQEVERHLDALKLERMGGDATFYIFISIKPSRLKSDAFCDRLLTEYKVSTVPGHGYGQSCDEYLRISVGNEPIARIVDGLKKISQLIASTSGALAPGR